MNLSNVTFGDALVLVGLALTLFIYSLERRAARNQDVESLRDALMGARYGIPAWAEDYFKNGFTEEAAKERAARDHKAVMAKRFNQVFRVPTSPLEALIDRVGYGVPLGEDTVTAVNTTLWQIGKFNQLVQQQADFLVTHLTDIKDPTLPLERKVAIAEAASGISMLLHIEGIGDAKWYQTLLRNLENEIQNLRRPGFSWRDVRLAGSVLTLVITVIIAIGSYGN